MRRVSRHHDGSREQLGQRRFLLSFCAIRAFTRFLTSAVGSGLSVEKWMVGRGEPLKLVLECLDHGRRREQTAVVRKCSEPHQRSLVIERRYPIADALGSLRWHSRPNRRANLVQGATGRFRDAGKVFVNIFRSAGALRGRPAIARFHLFHAGNVTRSSNFKSKPQACTHDEPFTAKWEQT